MTVVLDTDHEGHYCRVNGTHWICRSYTTRIAEVEGAGVSRSVSVEMKYAQLFVVVLTTTATLSLLFRFGA